MKIKFRDNRGYSFEVEGDMSVEKLLELGINRFKLVHPDKPLEQGEWRAEEPEK
jgi:hypothetical protein